MMRTATCCLAFALLAGAARAQGRIEERWPLDAAGSVRIVSPHGSIRVVGWDADSLAVSARLEPRAGQLRAAGDAHVRKLAIEAADPRNPGRAELEIHVPRGTVVWVRTATADIDVVGVDGLLDVSSGGGSIHVVGTPRDVTVETMSGNVELVGGTARARVKTVSGDILLRGASQDLAASTLSGRITVRAAGWQRGGTGVQRGRFESVTGDVRFEGELGRGGALELESQSGSIGLRVPASTVADYDVLTIEGTITNTLSDAHPKPSASSSGRELRFSTGPGGAQITVRSFKGAILLEPR